MTGGAQIVYLPDGLELLITGENGDLRIENYRWRIRKADVITGATSPSRPGDVLRAGRFRTVEDLIDAVRREIADRGSRAARRRKGGAAGASMPK